MTETEKFHRIFEGYYNQPEGPRKILNNDGVYHRPFMKSEMSDHMKLILEKEQYYINESRHIDFTFKDVIDAIKQQIIIWSKRPYYEFVRKFDGKHLIEQNFVYTGYAYNDIMHKVLISAPNDYSSHRIYLYPFHDGSSKVFGYAMQKDIFCNNDASEFEKRSSIIAIAVNVCHLKNEKCIAGTLWHEFNHILKMYINRHNNLLNNNKSSNFYFIDNDSRYDFIKEKDPHIFYKIYNFLYNISSIEQDAFVQSIYGAIAEYTDDEIKKLMQGPNDVISVVRDLDDEYVCGLGYELIKKRFEDISDVEDNIFIWLVIGNRYQECLFNEPFSAYFKYSFLVDYFNNNLVLDRDTEENIIKDINFIYNIVYRRVKKYRKRVESVTRDCLIERGIIEGTVYRNDKVTYDDVDVEQHKVKNKISNVYDDYDESVLKSYKKYLKDNS